MSIWRSLAIAILVSCSGGASPRSPSVVAPSAPQASPSASPEYDRACDRLAYYAPPDASAADDAATGSEDVSGDGGDDGGGRAVQLPPITACSVARVNFARAADAILAARAHPGKPAPRTPWDHRTPPARLDLIRRRFELAPDELAQLRRTGVVVPARLTQPGYAYAYHEIFQSQLPVYITADSVFHAIFASHDAIVEQLERDELAPALDEALAAMHCTLAFATDYPPETLRDLDLYLAVARSLASDDWVRSIRGDAAVNAAVSHLVPRVYAATGVEWIELFGRQRLVDFAAFAPRGHYGAPEAMTAYFRAAMWTSRIEFNLVSRSSRSSAPGPEPDPRETPREAIDALALADLAERSGATAAIDAIDRAWGLLAGRREDVSIAQLAQLRRTADIASLQAPTAFSRLKAAIGDGFQRTTRLHPMPEGSTVLPAIATLIGPRIVPDAQALMPVVHAAVPGRSTVHAADVVYGLGLDRARHYLAADLAAFPALDRQLAVARKIAQTTRLGDDLYSAWYAAIRALAVTPAGALPSFAATDAGADLRFNSITAAYGQLKHIDVLMDGQPYSEFGCAIPDGYVEPVPAAYGALIEYAARLRKLAVLLDPRDRTGAAAHATRLADTLRVLQAIADDELANRPLTAAEQRWLGMVTELSIDTSENITGHPPVYSGWYFDLFREAEADGMRGAAFIADYFTSVDAGTAYVGAAAPRLGIFVVDTGGAPRAFVGPVARAYEAHMPPGTWLTDADAAQPEQNVDEPRDASPLSIDPWAASYTVADPGTRPRLALRYDRDTGDVVITADHAIGPAKIKLLDHHRVPLATRTQRIEAGETVFAFHRKQHVGAVYVVVGAFRDWIVGDSYGQIGALWEPIKDSDE